MSFLTDRAQKVKFADYLSVDLPMALYKYVYDYDYELTRE